jgi:quinol monooxygenase YgiN
MILMKIMAIIEPDKMMEFKQAVDYILQRDKKNPQCVSRGLYHDRQSENTLLYLEEWKSVTELKKHLCNDRFKSLLGAMKVLGKIEDAQIIDTKTEQKLEDYLKQHDE